MVFTAPPLISTMATSMPSSDVPLMIPATFMTLVSGTGYITSKLRGKVSRLCSLSPKLLTSRALQLPLQFGQQLQRLDGPQFIDLQRADALGDFVADGLE